MYHPVSTASESSCGEDSRLRLIRTERKKTMVCTCTHRDCYYVFVVKGQKLPDQCPDCGSHSVRPATPDEIAWFLLEHNEEAKAG